MIKQGLDYDKDGEFIRLWVEELAGLRGVKVHCPWTAPRDLLERAGLELGVTYPPPLVNPPEWSRHLPRDNNKDTHTQRGINFYFKPEGPAAPAGKQQKKRKPLRGGRVQ